MSNYELVFIIDPNCKDFDIIKQKIVDILDATTELKTTVWGVKKFAYPIKKHDSGYYFQLNGKLESEIVKGLPRKLNLVKELLRFLIINLDTEKRFRYKTTISKSPTYKREPSRFVDKPEPVKITLLKPELTENKV